MIPIRPILEDYGATVPRPGRNDWQPMRCPFHGDEQASAAVNETAGRFICHGCMERSEDAVGIVQWQEDCDYRSAFKRCESVAGLSSGEVHGRPSRGRSLSDLFK